MTERLTLDEVNQILDSLIKNDLEHTKIVEKIRSIQYVMQDMPEGQRIVYLRLMNWL